MPQFSANLNFLFNEHDFIDRFEAAAKAGFRFVEFMFPYDYDIAEIKAKLQQHKLELVLFNLPAGDWAGGDRGLAADPSRAGEYRAGVPRAISVAKDLGVTQVNCLVGFAGSGASEEQVATNLRDNLVFTADAFAKEGINLLVEPINHLDMPGFYLNTTDQVASILKEMNRSNAFLQYDIYHAAREEEDLFAVVDNYADLIKHVQIADNPGRNEPGKGDLAVREVVAALENAGYQGYMGLEYKPSTQTEETLGWIREFGFTF